MTNAHRRLFISARAVRWVVVFAFLFGATAARANTVTYGYIGTVSSSVGSSGPADIMVRFTLLENQIEIAIWNFQRDIKSDISTLNSVDFVLSGQQTTGTITARSGMEVTLQNGTDVPLNILPGGAAAFTNDPDPHWPLIASTYYSGIGMELSALAGGNTHTIIGPPNASTGLYTNLNKSIPKHNPYLYTPDYSTPVQFTLNVPGVTSTDTVTQVRFGFGTDGTAEYDAQTPEPATWCLVGTGLLVALAWRRRRASTNHS